MVAVMGGIRLKIPTLANLARLKEDYELYEEINETDLDPDSIQKVAKKKNTKTQISNHLVF
jgi:hypothetical protein